MSLKELCLLYSWLNCFPLVARLVLLGYDELEGENACLGSAGPMHETYISAAIDQIKDSFRDMCREASHEAGPLATELFQNWIWYMEHKDGCEIFHQGFLWLSLNDYVDPRTQLPTTKLTNLLQHKLAAL